jgi:hypothetical protein
MGILSEGQGIGAINQHSLHPMQKDEKIDAIGERRRE